MRRVGVYEDAQTGDLQAAGEFTGFGILNGTGKGSTAVDFADGIALDIQAA
jgi:hypothetical protein